MYSRVIVPLDGSDVAEQALQDATALAQLTNASMLLVRVVTHPHLSASGMGAWNLQQSALAQLIEQDSNEATAYLDEIKARLEIERIGVSAEVRQGLPASAILNGTGPGDVIVMGTHGRGGMKRWFLGSVAEDVVRHATVPVLLVRTGSSA